jgi:outer membrane protein assembly factor BamB
MLAPCSLRSVALGLAVAAAPVPPDGRLEQWGQWRGPLGNGVAPHGRPPLSWSETHGVRWKTPIPGRGHSSPVVWGDRVFLTTAIPHGETHEPGAVAAPGAHDNVPPARDQRFVVLAVDRRDGSIAWQTTVRTGRPHDSTHETGSWASPSAVTDGAHVIASFGSAGLYGLAPDGRVLWQVDLGDMQALHGHGEGSSPALHGETVVVNWDHEAGSFVAALDKRTGELRWKVPRQEGTSWSTPLVVEHAGRAQVVVAATRRVRAYDLADGRLLWECGGLSGNVVASPVAGDGYVYAANSYDSRAMLAVRLDRARGDITGTDAVAWTRDRDTPYVPSPLLDGDALCFLKHYQGLWTCLEARTGRALFGPERLPGVGNVYASPVAAGDRVYVAGLDGTTAVLRRGPAFAVLAQNRLDDSFAASPAIAGDALFLRGERHLYCLAATPPP